MAAQCQSNIGAKDLLTHVPDEPRRSGRATKGQHKNLELPDAPSKKGKGKAKSDKSSKASAEPTPGPSEGDEEEIIRCICGEYEEEEDVERDMICCDSCSAWQHNDCMGLTFVKGQEPDNYYCEQCRPENHKPLLAKIASGEKPWEAVAERRRQEAEEKKSKRKKGGKKGGKKSRPSETKTEAGTPARAGTSATPGPGASPAPAASASAEPEKNGQSVDSRRSSTNKRKLEEGTEADTEPQVKQQRISSESPASTRTKSEPVTNARVDDLQIPARKSAATAFIKLFKEQAVDAHKTGSFSLTGQAAEETATRLGLDIENAMYRNLCGNSGEPDDAYKAQLRTILFNVKKNPSLRDRLLVGNLSPDSLSTMKPEDMASKELQQKDAEIKRESDRQHTIVQEQGPRIRRTHKGEELIEDETHNAATESIFSAAPRRLTTDLEGSPGGQSPITPKMQQGSIQKNEGQSPTGEHHDQVFPEVAAHIREPVPHGNVQADADIDKLLRDDEPESPPYSPQDFADDGISWRGKVSMVPVGEFASSAKYVGGADFSDRLPWSVLAPTPLQIDGRIEIKLASDYLCGLRFSQSTDVTILSVNYPDVPSEQDGFNKLFNYFTSRQRFGVIGKHPMEIVKDVYVVPVEAGTTKKPEFLELLENNTLEETTSQRMFLIVFVIKGAEFKPTDHSVSDTNPYGEETMYATNPLDVQGRPQDAYKMLPIPAGLITPTPLRALSGRRKPWPEAIEVLGPFVNTPAILQLLMEDPEIQRRQLEAVRAILDQQSSLADDISLLMPAYVQWKKGHPSGISSPQQSFTPPKSGLGRYQERK